MKPDEKISTLSLPRAGDLVVAGYDGKLARVRIYYVDLTVAGTAVDLLRVVTISGGQALLGRDVLNYFYTRLNGPDLTFDLAGTLEVD